MPVSRLAWVPAQAFAELNQRLRTFFDIADRSARVGFRVQATSGPVELSVPDSLVVLDASAANVDAVLPPANTVPNYRVTFKVQGANLVTVAPNAAELIDGSNTALSVAGLLGLVCTGRAWVRVTS